MPTAGLGSWFARDERNRQNNLASLDAGAPERRSMDGMEMSVQSSISDSYCPRPPPRYPSNPRGRFRPPARPEDMVIAVKVKQNPLQDPKDEHTDSTDNESSEKLDRPTMFGFRENSHSHEMESLDMSIHMEEIDTEGFLAQVETEAAQGVSGYENDAGEVVFKGWEAPAVQEEPKKSSTSWWGVKKDELKLSQPPSSQLEFVTPQSIEDAIKELQMLEGIRVKCLDESSQQLEVENVEVQDHAQEEIPIETKASPQNYETVAEANIDITDHSINGHSRANKKGWLIPQNKSEPQQDQVVLTPQLDQYGPFKQIISKHENKQQGKAAGWWSGGSVKSRQGDYESDDETVSRMAELLADDESAALTKLKEEKILQSTHVLVDNNTSQEIRSGWFFNGKAAEPSPRGQPTIINLGSMTKVIEKLSASNDEGEGRISDRRSSTPDSMERELNQIDVDSAKLSDEQILPDRHDSPMNRKQGKSNEQLAVNQHNAEPYTMMRAIGGVSSDAMTPTEIKSQDSRKTTGVSFSSFNEVSTPDTIDKYMREKPICTSGYEGSTLMSSSRRSSTGETAYKKINFNTRRSSTPSTPQEPILENLTPSTDNDSPTSSKRAFLSWSFLKNLTKEQVSPTSSHKRVSTTSSFGGLLRPPPNRDFTTSLRKGTLLDNKEELDMRFKWNQQLLSSTFAPYRKMVAEVDDLLPADDEYYAVKEARESNEVNFSEIRDRMLENGEITEREVAAFFDAFALCTVKTQSLQSQILGLKAVRRAEDEEKDLRHSVARTAAINSLIRDPNTTQDVKLVLRHLETAEKKQSNLEAQLKELGVVLEEIKTEEEEQIYQEWEHQHEVDNLAALTRIRRHMAVNIKSATEAQLSSETTPNGKVLPKRFAKKFKATNVLQLIRMGPGDIEQMHPATLENLCIDGLTLTEARALHAHLRPVGEYWKQTRNSDLDERRYMWFTLMKQNFKDALEEYQQHAKEYGPPGNHPYDTRATPFGGCPLIGKQCPLKADKLLEYNFDYGYPDGPEYDEPGSLKTENEFARSKARKAAEAIIAEKALDRSESFKAHYARFENMSTNVLLANASCEAMDYAMDRMEFLQVRWIKMRILSDRDGASTDEQLRNEIMGFTEAIQNVSLAVAQAAERSGMTLTGATLANNKKPDFRGDIECGLAEELCETAECFITGIEERLSASRVKDEYLHATILHLRTLQNDLHQRNVDNLMKLGARRPPRSRKIRSREEIETRINTKINAAKKKQEELAGIAPPPLTGSRPTPTPTAATTTNNRGSVAQGRMFSPSTGTNTSRIYGGTTSKLTSSTSRTSGALGSNAETKPSVASPLPASTNITSPPKETVVSAPVSSTMTPSPRSSPMNTSVLISQVDQSTVVPTSATLLSISRPTNAMRTTKVSTTDMTPFRTDPYTVATLPLAPTPTISISTTTRTLSPKSNRLVTISAVPSTSGATSGVVPCPTTRPVSSPVPTEPRKRESIEEIKARIAARRIRTMELQSKG